ncbi:hypothetical protein O5466_24280 [Escherichia coli]|nr:hypothetical protein [Escherichia coli]
MIEKTSCIYHNIPCPHRSGRVQRESGVSSGKTGSKLPAKPRILRLIASRGRIAMQPRELLMLSMYILVQAPVLTPVYQKPNRKPLPLTIKEVGGLYLSHKKHLQHDFYRIDSIKNEIHSPIKGFYMKDMKAVVVFTGKDLNIMRN